MSVPIKVEVFSHNNLSKPHTTFNYDHFRLVRLEQRGFISVWVDTLQEDFKSYRDFPSSDRLIEIFITNKQKVFEKLYLDNEGDILTVIKFTVEEN